MLVTIIILLQACKTLSVQMDVLDCGIDHALDVAEGDVEISQYPWVGVLFYSYYGMEGDSRSVTTVVLIQAEFVIAAAADIGPMSKTNFRKNSRVLLGEGWDRPGRRVRNYVIHPEYGETYNTVALVQLSSPVRDIKIKPVCPPPDFLRNPVFYVIKMKEEVDILEKEVINVMHIPGKLCRDFYMAAHLYSRKMRPPYVACAVATKSEGVCVWSAGSALVSRDVWGRWQLLGLGVRGPGCGAPSRFLDMMSYYPWVEQSLSQFNRITISKISKQKYVLRSSLSYQRFGACDPEEKLNLVYRETIVLRTDNRQYQFMTYNLTLIESVEYTCLTMELQNASAVSEMKVTHYCPRVNFGPACYFYKGSVFDIAVYVMFSDKCLFEMFAWGFRKNMTLLDIQEWKWEEGTYYGDFSVTRGVGKGGRGKKGKKKGGGKGKGGGGGKGKGGGGGGGKGKGGGGGAGKGGGGGAGKGGAGGAGGGGAGGGGAGKGGAGGAGGGGAGGGGAGGGGAGGGGAGGGGAGGGGAAGGGAGDEGAGGGGAGGGGAGDGGAGDGGADDGGGDDGGGDDGGGDDGGEDDGGEDDEGADDEGADDGGEDDGGGGDDGEGGAGGGGADGGGGFEPLDIGLWVPEYDIWTTTEEVNQTSTTPIPNNISRRPIRPNGTDPKHRGKTSRTRKPKKNMKGFKRTKFPTPMPTTETTSTTPTTTTTEAPEEPPPPPAGGGCFPEGSMVYTENGPRDIATIRRGDKVLSASDVGKMIYSEVLTFLDRDPNATQQFIEVTAENGVTITTTPTHLLLLAAGDGWREEFASNVQVGDELLTRGQVGDGLLTRGQADVLRPARVVKIRRVSKRGEYAPLTRTGTIVVDEALASCYAMVRCQWFAHAATAPLRWMAPWSASSELPRGLHWYANVLNSILYSVGDRVLPSSYIYR